MMENTQSIALFDKAMHYIPGGVNSPVRAFKKVGGHPPIIRSGQGPYLTDVDGNQYIDYVGSWGPLILGHAHPEVINAVTQTLARGTSFGAPCELELDLAKQICHLVPSVEKVRFVNSGTEATMTAVRLARGVTHRNKIIKFQGCYHGHSDALLVEAGSGPLTLGLPSSPGIPEATTADTLIASFNHLESVSSLFERYSDDIAAIIIEPVAANMNLVMPTVNFLKGLRELCNHYQSLLIFDEVMTGFRLGFGGAQEVYQVTPDITTLGKVIGGGMPVGAVGGRAEVMDQLAPAGPVYQAGTLSGNPICMAAGLATLKAIQVPGFFANLFEKNNRLRQGLLAAAKKATINFRFESIGSMFGMYFTDETGLMDYEKVQQCNMQHFKDFFHGMLNRGIYLAPSPYEVGFISSAHTNEIIDKTISAAERVFSSMSV